MFRNFLTVALRGFLRNKTYSAINVSGLALGILSASLIFLYVYDEFWFDTVHPNSKNLYSIGVSVIDKNGTAESYGVAPGGWAQSLKDDFPDIEGYTRLLITGFPHSLHNKTTDRIVLNRMVSSIGLTTTFQESCTFPL